MARGARPGNQHALKHGRRTARFLRLYAEVMEEIHRTDLLLARIYYGVRGRNPALLPLTGCDFMSSDKRGQGAAPPPETSPREKLSHGK